MIPGWAAWIVSIAAILAAAGYLWNKVVRPSIRAAAAAEEAVPVMRELTSSLRNSPHAGKILAEILAQFRTDSGSSLRDAVDRLEKAAHENQATAEILRVSIEAGKLVDEVDRTAMRRLERALDRLTDKVEAGVAGIARAAVTADNVAADLAAAHRRADEVSGDKPHGAAADAASRQTAEELERPE